MEFTISHVAYTVYAQHSVYKGIIGQRSSSMMSHSGGWRGPSPLIPKPKKELWTCQLAGFGWLWGSRPRVQLPFYCPQPSKITRFGKIGAVAQVPAIFNSTGNDEEANLFCSGVYRAWGLGALGSIALHYCMLFSWGDSC